MRLTVTHGLVNFAGQTNEHEDETMLNYKVRPYNQDDRTEVEVIIVPSGEARQFVDVGQVVENATGSITLYSRRSMPNEFGAITHPSRPAITFAAGAWASYMYGDAVEMVRVND